MKSTRTFLLVLAAAVTLVAAGSNLKKLPADYKMPQGKESPGVVTFRHATHVDQARPDCTTCHPKDYRINEYGKPADGGEFTHARFDKGELCGSCHGQANKTIGSSKPAFKMTRCDRCHEEPLDEEEEE